MSIAEELAYRGAEDHALLNADRMMDKAVDAHDRGDDIGAQFYLGLARQWTRCRHSLTRTPFGESY